MGSGGQRRSLWRGNCATWKMERTQLPLLPHPEDLVGGGWSGAPLCCQRRQVATAPAS